MAYSAFFYEDMKDVLHAGRKGMKRGYHIYGDRDYTPIGEKAQGPQEPVGDGRQPAGDPDAAARRREEELDAESKRRIQAADFDEQQRQQREQSITDDERQANENHRAVEAIKQKNKEDVKKALLMTAGIGLTAAVVGSIFIGKVNKEQRKNAEQAHEQSMDFQRLTGAQEFAKSKMEKGFEIDKQKIISKADVAKEHETAWGSIMKERESAKGTIGKAKYDAQGKIGAEREKSRGIIGKEKLIQEGALDRQHQTAIDNQWEKDRDLKRTHKDMLWTDRYNAKKNGSSAPAATPAPQAPTPAPVSTPAPTATPKAAPQNPTPKAAPQNPTPKAAPQNPTPKAAPQNPTPKAVPQTPAARPVPQAPQNPTPTPTATPKAAPQNPTSQPAPQPAPTATPAHAPQTSTPGTKTPFFNGLKTKLAGLGNGVKKGAAAVGNGIQTGARAVGDFAENTWDNVSDKVQRYASGDFKNDPPSIPNATPRFMQAKSRPIPSNYWALHNKTDFIERDIDPNNPTFKEKVQAVGNSVKTGAQATGTFMKNTWNNATSRFSKTAPEAPTTPAPYSPGEQGYYDEILRRTGNADTAANSVELARKNKWNVNKFGIWR